MSRDFDAGLEKDRKFKVAKQEFEYRFLHWRELAQLIDDESAREAAAFAEAREKASQEGVEPEDVSVETLVDQLDRVVERICEYLVADDQDRFRKLALGNENGSVVSWGQLMELRDWLGDQQTARPTKQPATSSRGRSTTAAS